MNISKVFNIQFYFAMLIYVLTTLVIPTNAYAFGDSLDDIHEDIKEKYPINHINNTQFSQANPGELIVFDVRKPSEFEVSHIDNAIKVNPGIKPEDFFAQYGNQLNGKTAIFYCSVGRRSSHLLSKLNNQLSEHGVENAYNLEGGIFRWHNDKKALVRNQQNTQDVHPYNFYWGRLIDDRKSIRYKVTDD